MKEWLKQNWPYGIATLLIALSVASCIIAMLIGHR